MTAAVLFPGDVVEEGVGPVRCGRTDDRGRVCTGLVGWPRVGSRLLKVEPSGCRLGACEEAVVAFRCASCSGVSIWLAPEVASRDGAA